MAIVKDFLPDNKKVRREYDRIYNLFSAAPQERLDLAREQMARAAFLAVTLRMLEEDMLLHGFAETYQNGEHQSGSKQSVSAGLHAAYTKNYLAVMKQLFKLFDEFTTDEVGDEFDQF